MIYMSLYDFIMLLCLPDYPFISVYAHDYESSVQKCITIKQNHQDYSGTVKTHDAEVSSKYELR